MLFASSVGEGGGGVVRVTRHYWIRLERKGGRRGGLEVVEIGDGGGRGWGILDIMVSVNIGWLVGWGEGGCTHYNA